MDEPKEEIEKIEAKDFQTRTELESFVRNKFGLSTEKKLAEIVGTIGELAKLKLSPRSTFWGISCVGVEPEEDVADVVPEKVNRGKRTGFGINNKDNKIK